MVPLLLIQLMMLTFGSTFAQMSQTDTPAQSNNQAQNTGASTAISGKGASGSVDVSFQRLGKKMLELHAPRDVEEFELSLPYRWQITGTDNETISLSLPTTSTWMGLSKAWMRSALRSMFMSTMP